MDALTKIWTGLDTRKRAFLIGGSAALVVILIILTRLATAPSYSLLYSGLDPAAAGEVVSAIQAQGVAYRVEGDQILVDRRERDSLRLTLAGDGLPANGAAGYELLDTLSGFGTTSQMFDAAYWRAKEGELARTIVASPRIRGARVHIANPGADPFQPAQEVTASVAIRPAAGGLSPGHPQALRYMVASSVPGLLPENVTVIDADSGQVLGGAELMSPAADAAGRAEALRRNIERLLAARVGPGNAVVQVSVEMTTAHETILERRIDPESRIVVATDTEERTDTSRDDGAVGVTVASNLPEGDAAGDGGSSSSQASETRERVTYDVSELQREVEHVPGDIRRISVAVLLNGVPSVTEAGSAVLAPRPEEEIAALRALVETAIGFDATRGDAVRIESMAFDEAAGATLTTDRFVDRVSFDLGRLLQGLVLAAAALFIAFGLLRPLLRVEQTAALPANRALSPQGHSLPRTELGPGLAELSQTVGPTSAPPQTGADAPLSMAESPAALPAPQPPRPAAAVADNAPLPADPVERLRRLIEEREEETVDILRSWMEDDAEAQP